MDWGAGSEWQTTISTPFQELNWSAAWSASLLTPKINVDWSVDCTPLIIAELECGLHSKKTGVPNTLAFHHFDISKAALKKYQRST